MTQRYSQLDQTPICETLALLARRIEERFPGSGLSGVAAELVRVAGQNQEVIERLRRPVWWLRGLTVLVIGTLVALTVWAGLQLARMAKVAETLADVLQASMPPPTS